MSSTFERLGLDSPGVAERLELINALWDSVATEPRASPVQDRHAARLRHWLGASTANCDPDELDDEILASIAGRLRGRRTSICRAAAQALHAGGASDAG